MSPLGVHFSPKQSAIIVACIWVAAAATASPALFVMQVRSIKEENGTTLRCDEYGWNERNASIYTLTLLAVYYCIPLLVMVIIYSRISIFLWFRKIPGAEELSLPVRQKLYSKKMKRKRTIRLLITVVTAFLICHLPQNIMSMIWYVFKHSFRPPYYMTAIAFFSEFMLHSNSSLNPILYAFLHKKFKESARILFKAVFRGQPMRETSLVQTKSRTTTLISLRTRSSCQNSAKALLSPVRRERMSQTSKLVSPSTRLLMETQNL